MIILILSQRCHNMALYHKSLAILWQYFVFAGLFLIPLYFFCIYLPHSFLCTHVTVFVVFYKTIIFLMAHFRQKSSWVFSETYRIFRTLFSCSLAKVFHKYDLDKTSGNLEAQMNLLWILLHINIINFWTHLAIS